MSIIFDFVPQVRNLFYSKTSRIQKLVVKIWAEFPQKKSEANLIFAIAYKISFSEISINFHSGLDKNLDYSRKIVNFDFTHSFSIINIYFIYEYQLDLDGAPFPRMLKLALSNFSILEFRSRKLSEQLYFQFQFLAHLGSP